VDVFAGLMLGALVGLLVGLSSVPIVGAVVTALIALLVTFFGLQASDAKLSAKASAARIGGFGLGMSVLLVVGVLARSHGWLQPSIGDRVDHYVGAGFAPAIALDLALFDQSGLLTGSLAGQTAPERPTATSGLLFTDKGDPNCTTLAADRFDHPEDRFKAMQQAGGEWAVVGKRAAAAGGQTGTRLAEAGWLLACSDA